MDKIRELRQARGMKQTDLAEKLSCSAMTVSRYERGEADPDLATICRLCEIFGCTADYLLGRSIMPAAELTEEEAAVLLAWRAASPQIREAISVLLRPAQPSQEESAG